MLKQEEFSVTLEHDEPITQEEFDRNLLARMKLIERNFSFADNYDLLVIAGLALLLPLLLIIPEPVIRVPLGLIITLFAPGYALGTAIFVRRKEMDGTVRFLSSFGLSLAVLPLLALLINWLPWGIQIGSITVSLSVWLLVMSGIAAVRRWRVSPFEVEAAVPRAGFKVQNWWEGMTTVNKTAFVAGLFIVVSLLNYGIFAFSTVKPEVKPTEFYMLGAEGTAKAYPRTVTVGETVSLKVGVHNQEPTALTYRLEAKIGNVTLVNLPPFKVNSGVKWEQEIQFSLANSQNDQKIDIYLYQTNQTVPYRQLVLWLNVKPTL
jgi:uncharacterized membrane protein